MIGHKRLADCSLRQKITAIILAISATGLLVFTLIFALIELSMSRERLLDHFTVLAESVARKVPPPSASSISSRQPTC